MAATAVNSREVVDALRALYEAEGHDGACRIVGNGCDCGTWARRAEARAMAAKALRNCAPASAESDEAAS